jgi:hypothetical protein
MRERKQAMFPEGTNFEAIKVPGKNAVTRDHLSVIAGGAETRPGSTRRASPRGTEVRYGRTVPRLPVLATVVPGKDDPFAGSLGEGSAAHLGGLVPRAALAGGPVQMVFHAGLIRGQCR